MNKNVMLAIAAFVMAGIVLAGVGVGAQLIDRNGPPDVLPIKPPVVDPVSDETCAEIAAEIATVMTEQGGEPIEAKIIARLRAAEANGRDLTALAEIRGDPRPGDVGTTEWAAPQCPIEPYTWDMYVFTFCGERVKGGLLWDEADNNLDLYVATCWDFDWSYDVGTLTEETRWVCSHPCVPCTDVWVCVDHYGSSCDPCECPPTCQFYWLAIDDDACCFDECPVCGVCGGGGPPR